MLLSIAQSRTASIFLSSLNKFIAHIRSDTSIGTSIKIAMDAYQILLGTRTPFLEANPDSIPHRIPAHHSKLTFLWEELYKIGAYIKITDHWVPQKQYSNDEAIMDSIITAKHKHRGTSTFIPTQRIIYANPCRLWLKVTMLSDITNENGTQIVEEHLYGTAQKKTDLTYPHQEKPPPHAWKEWRMAICQCFLGRATSASETHLLRPFQGSEQQREVSVLYRNLSQTGATLQHIFTLLPTLWQNILGPVTWPEDGGLSILASPRNKSTIHTYLDGSVAVGRGAHAYTIRPECESPSLAIVSTAPSPGDPDIISSLCPEHYGGMCILIWIRMLEQKFGPIKDGCIVCHIDNDTVVKRLSTGMPPKDTPTRGLATDFDVWIESATIMTKITCAVSFRHVKGHQDDFIVKHNQEGPLNRHAFWNVQMDRLADKTRKGSNALQVPFYESSKIALIVKGSAVTTKAEKIIR